MNNCAKPRLLYIMGIDWDWIFQRPQIIAQHLAKENDITVVFPRSILKFFARRRSCRPLPYKILWTLPLQEKIGIIQKVSRLLNRHIFKNTFNYNTIVIGFPLYYRYIPDNYSGTLIYDCMDNHETLYSYRPGVTTLLKQEQSLISHSSIIFVSSRKLMEKLTKYNISPLTRMVLLRNGTAVPDSLPPMTQALCQTQYKIGYIGTIADWFDTDLLRESLQKVDGIEYHLIGPVNTPLPRDEQRIIQEGVVCHNLLYEKVQFYSCLIMPFRLDETVLCVDPVKLYEYIAMGKCIIAVYYPEIERFQDFVYFYHDISDYVQLLSELKKQGFPPKYTSRQRLDFLEKNSWENRFAVWDKTVNERNQIQDFNQYVCQSTQGV